jgi:hypothetical protein
MGKLTDRGLAPFVNLNTLIHIVNTGDTSQSPDGSSYKAPLSDLSSLFTDATITGFTFDNFSYDLSISLSDNTIYSQNLGILASDIKVTGGTFDSNTGEIIFVNNSGGSFTVSGLSVDTDLGNVLFVSENGNDLTAQKGDLHKPWQNIYAAKSAATSGDTIYVFPGTWIYDNRNSAGNPFNGQINTRVNLWKNGITYYFSSGSKIVFYNLAFNNKNLPIIFAMVSFMQNNFLELV